MVLNRYGNIVNASWEWLNNQFQYVDLDTWVIMPNHLCGIILLEKAGP